MSKPDQSAVCAHINQGNAYFETGAFDEAIANYTKAIDLKSERVFPANHVVKLESAR